MYRHKIWMPVLAVVSALVVLSGSVLAASTGKSNSAGGNGLRVSPVRSDVTIAPGKTQVIPVTVNNVTALPASFQAIINDFVASPNESGNPALIIDPKQSAPSHSLKRFVQPIPNFTLQPGQSKTISVTINVPANASGGGYYGAVRFAAADSGNGSNKTVSLSGSVGSLIILTVPGNITDKLSVSSFDVRRHDVASSFFTSNKGIDVVTRFQNEGNIQEQPFGKILLKNNSNKTLAEYELNNVEPRGNVLPDSIRKFTIPLDKVGSLGIYKLEGNFGYGSNGQLLSASTSFYVIPLAVIIGFVAIVLFLLFLIFGVPRLIRAYNRHILRQAGRR